MFWSLVHLMLSLSISYPYLIKFPNFADNSQEVMKHQMGGETQAQQGTTFRITLIFTFHFLTMRTGPWLHARWEPERFSSQVRTFNPDLTAGSHWTVLNENRNENQRRFSARRWEPPNTGSYCTIQLSRPLSGVLFSFEGVEPMVSSFYAP
jgi:hypothetical protein